MAGIRAELEELRDLMQHYCFKYGDFILSSGRPSNFYYDGKRATLRPSAAALVGRVLADLIIGSRAEAVGGLEIGSVPIANAVGWACLEKGHEIPSFIVRKQAKSHGTKDEIAQAYVESGDLLKTGTSVVIVDDVITTGGSIQKAIDAVEHLGCRVSMVVVLVERHEGGAAEMRRHHEVLSIFNANDEGTLSVNEDFVRRVEAAFQAA